MGGRDIDDAIPSDTFGDCLDSLKHLQSHLSEPEFESCSARPAQGVRQASDDLCYSWEVRSGHLCVSTCLCVAEGVFRRDAHRAQR